MLKLIALFLVLSGCCYAQDEVQRLTAVINGAELSAGMRGMWKGYKPQLEKRLAQLKSSKAKESKIAETQQIIDKLDKMTEHYWQIPILSVNSIKKDSIGIIGTFSFNDLRKSSTIIDEGDSNTPPLVDFNLDPIEVEVIKVIATDKAIVMAGSKSFIVRDFDMSDVADGDKITIDRICIAEKTEYYADRKMWSLRCLSRKDHDRLIEKCIAEMDKRGSEDSTFPK